MELLISQPQEQGLQGGCGEEYKHGNSCTSQQNPTQQRIEHVVLML